MTDLYLEIINFLFHRSISTINNETTDQLKVPKLPNVGITCMTQYSSEFEFPVLSPPQRMNKVLAETISAAGRTQTHIAETEKYAHVTFFFNGGREEPFHGENRVLIPSPKVSTYDLKPEMSVMEVAKAVDHAMQGGSDCLVMCNLAPPDMVGHTGCFEPTIRAVEATDTAIGLIYNACVRENYTLIVTSDHGNAEWMLDDEGKPFTAHTCQPVPFLICDSSVELRKNVDSAALCDVAPTILALIGGIETPEEMTGKSLIINPV